MVRTVIAGSGNVAEALCRAMLRCGNAPVQVFARNGAEGRKLAAMCGCDFTGDPAKLAEADLYILAVSDSAIAGLSEALDFRGGVVAHTAGSVPIGELSAGVADRAVIYPLQTFTKGREVDLRHVPVFVEGATPRALETALEFARAISSDVRELDSEKRAWMHLAAVFACNFTNYMYTVSEGVVRRAGLDFDVLKPLVVETALKACDAHSPADVQTGPAVRGDRHTMDAHLKLLEDRPELTELYNKISELIWETSKKTSDG